MFQESLLCLASHSDHLILEIHESLRRHWKHTSEHRGAEYIKLWIFLHTSALHRNSSHCSLQFYPPWTPIRDSNQVEAPPFPALPLLIPSSWCLPKGAKREPFPTHTACLRHLAKTLLFWPKSSFHLQTAHLPLGPTVPRAPGNPTDPGCPGGPGGPEAPLSPAFPGIPKSKQKNIPVLHIMSRLKQLTAPSHRFCSCT